MNNPSPTPSDDAAKDASHAPSTRLSLSQLKRGQTGIIAEASLPKSDLALLSAMGLCTHARIRLCRCGEPCIVAVCARSGEGSNRIGLARPLAERIIVTLDA